MFGIPEILFVAILLAILAFEVMMFIHAIRNRRLTSSSRALWIVGMLLIHPFVAIAYYFAEYRRTH
jgi:hypothetical protein